ncbi:DUF1876 domain-containing protein [Wenjunlia tyrosinilytica]|jgi:hypothetical protein|uniref:DUF1876 domain-containing protein n=1 Tax=Wenjunlia tyrosinilytica TaxID=1544741 RepID=A0A917ZS17_9ACTN|nr:DUF1876 domain-containing protein [Wenjunlia tyrosinilytica]GGO90473.1 hypothetical protein GCM10012280_36110 [Wenjunlia tyrosinilytica]
MARTLEWKVRLYLFEEEGTTKARMTVDTGATVLTGRGAARCNPCDADVPEIGDELAAGRAMDDLAHQFLSAAERDIAGVERAAAG